MQVQFSHITHHGPLCWVSILLCTMSHALNQTVNGDTALHMAANNGHIQLVAELISVSEGKAWKEEHINMRVRLY